MKMNKNRPTVFKGFKVIVFNGAQMQNILPVVEATGNFRIYNEFLGTFDLSAE